jgi:PleD family two-component response regulator
VPAEKDLPTLLTQTTPLRQARRNPVIPGNDKPQLPSTQPCLPRGRVLLVDEYAKDLNYFNTLLARIGYSTRAFTNYREAERCLEREHFDFVIVGQGSPAFETQLLV